MLDEGLLRIIRMVLQLLGTANSVQEIEVGQCYKPKCRRRRSLVRSIGSSLPLAPIHRVHFQIIRRSEPPPWLHRQPQFYEEDCAHIPIPTLSDLPWLVMASPVKDIRSRSEWRPIRGKKQKKTIAVRPLHHTPPEDKSCPKHPMAGTPSSDTTVFSYPSPPPPKASNCFGDEAKVNDPVAMKKISALEEELERLRAQIAMIVTIQSQTHASDSCQSTPVNHASMAPTMATPPPPCGAPPPPPPPPLVSTPRLNAIDLIKQNRNKNKNKTNPLGSGMPNMAEVLKGLGTVKLKSIARSPGGTPMRQAPKPSDATDPAAIIARALKRKFAHARLSCSPTANKENINHSGSPVNKSSPVHHSSPKFGPHLLKPRNRAQLNTRQPHPLSDVNA